MKRITFVDPATYEPGQLIELPPDIDRALVCLDRTMLKARNWRPLPSEELTDAEKVMRMLEGIIKVPSGMMVGKPLRFMFFQEIVLYILIDIKPVLFILSMARRNGKTFILACIVLINLITKLATQNSSIASAAMSRDQAALVFKEIENMAYVSPQIMPFLKITPSGKRLLGVVKNAEYQALAAEAKTGFGRSFKVVIFDEAGQVVGADNDYISMLRTSQGSIEDPLFAVISTQAASDGDYLSIMIDTAIRDNPPDTAVMLFDTPKDKDIDDEESWYLSNPGLGVFRSLKDMRQQAATAKRIPESEAKFRNLNLNQRIALQGLWLSPAVWKECAAPADLAVFRGNYVCLALDLSLRTDLTAAVFAAVDDNDEVHLIPHVFTPMVGIEQREMRDKSPYQHWVREGHMIAVPGSIIEYSWVAEYLNQWCRENDIDPSNVSYDRWRMDVLQREFNNLGAFTGAEWVPVGQGYRDMSPRLEHFEALALARRLRHGNHPLLNLAVSSAIAVRDPAGNRKLEKSKSTQRIDPLVAAVMAAFGLGNEDFVDVESWVA